MLDEHFPKTNFLGWNNQEILMGYVMLEEKQILRIGKLIQINLSS